MNTDTIFSFVFCLCLVFKGLNAAELNRSNSFGIKIEKKFQEEIFSILENRSFYRRIEITPETWVIEYNGSGNALEAIKELSQICRNKIIYLEPVRIYENTFQPADVSEAVPELSQPDIIGKQYYAKNVEDTWTYWNVSGKKIIIGIADLGVNIDLLDLKNNINPQFSKNFFKNTQDVSPEIIPDTYRTDEVEALADHGNRVASVVAAEKGNAFCSCGIAFNAKIAVLKTYELRFDNQNQHNESKQKPVIWTAADILASALVHERDDIDVLVIAWSPATSFDRLDELTLDMLSLGVQEGRLRLGRIYLVPAGPASNLLSNNIHTITIGGIGRFGNVPSGAVVDPSVITSGLADGHNITSFSLITTSHGNNCISSFGGLSAATAQVAGIIALGLQANPYLSQRAILHLLVEASEYTGLNETSEFKRNNAGKYFHKKFGFGLLNSFKFVDMAKHAKPILDMRTTTLSSVMKRFENCSNVDITICFNGSDAQNDKGANSIEYVNVLMNITATTKNLGLEIVLISPSYTESLLMNDTLPQDNMKLQGNFVTANFWNEVSYGVWTLRIHSHMGGSVKINGIKMIFYGTYNPNYINVAQNDICRSKSVEDSSTATPPDTLNKNQRKEEYKESQNYGENFVLGLALSVPFIIAIVSCVLYNRVPNPLQKS